MLELRQELLSTCAERDQLLAEKRKWDVSSACSSMMSSSEGGDLQEILQGVREVKNHGEGLKSYELPTLYVLPRILSSAYTGSRGAETEETSGVRSVKSYRQTESSSDPAGA